MAYDRCLISDGRKAVRAPVPGANLKGSSPCEMGEPGRSRANIDEHQAKSALVIGARPHLASRRSRRSWRARIKVTVVELAIASSALSSIPRAARLAGDHLRRDGVELRTKTTVGEIIGRGGRVDHASCAMAKRVNATCRVCHWRPPIQAGAD